MARTRQWQVRVAYEHGGQMTFGVSAPSRGAAIERARVIADVPGLPPGTMKVTRLYGRYHPWRATQGREEPGSGGALADPSVPGAWHDPG